MTVLGKFVMLTVDAVIGVGIILISPLLGLLVLGWGVIFITCELCARLWRGKQLIWVLFALMSLGCKKVVKPSAPVPLSEADKLVATCPIEIYATDPSGNEFQKANEAYQVCAGQKLQFYVRCVGTPPTTTLIPPSQCTEPSPPAPPILGLVQVK